MVKITIIMNKNNIMQEKQRSSNDNKYSSILQYLGEGGMDFANLDIEMLNEVEILEKIEKPPNVSVVFLDDKPVLKSAMKEMTDNLAKPLQKKNSGLLNGKNLLKHLISHLKVLVKLWGYEKNVFIL